jgi:hypothetical protein
MLKTINITAYIYIYIGTQRTVNHVDAFQKVSYPDDIDTTINATLRVSDIYNDLEYGMGL